MSNSEQFEGYKQLFEKINNKKLDLNNIKQRQELYNFILQKRKIISKILNNKKGQKFIEQAQSGNKKVKWFDLIAESREILGIPKKVPYEIFNIYIQLIKTNKEDIDFDIFLKMFKNKELKRAKGEISDNIDNLMDSGGGSDFHAISEIISNAIDATNPANVVGRFGKGFFQIGRFLNEKGVKVVVDSKKQGSKPYKITLENDFLKDKEKELYVSSMISKKENVGTTVDIQKKLTQNEIEEIIDYIKNKFKTNKSVNVLVNNEKINNLNKYVYVNGKGLEEPINKIEIEVTENGIKVIDNGIGMNSEELSTKLLYPNDTSKERKVPKDDELKSVVAKEVSFFYEPLDELEKKDKTNISLMIGGVIIESFHTETSNNIKDFVLEFPSFTYLMENKDDISMTKEVIISLEIMLEKIHNKVDDKNEKIAILEILGKIVEYLKQRPTEDSNSGKYNIDKIFKKNFTSLKKDLEKDGTIVLSGDKRLKEALGKKNNICYVSPDFESLEITNIPNIQKLQNIENAKVHFYTIDFDKNSKISYIITKKGILVDSKYLNKKETREILNTLVNLNLGYEIKNEEVFYGTIIDGKVVEQKLEKNNGISGIENDINSNSSDIKNENHSNELNYDNLDELIKFKNQEKEFKFDNDILSLMYDLINENEFLEYQLNRKMQFFDNDFFKQYNVENFYNSSGKLNSDIEFFMLSKFSFDKSLGFENKKKYIDFFETASINEKKTILKFQNYIKDIDNKWDYLNQILILLENDKAKKQVLEILSNFGDDVDIIGKIKALKDIEEKGVENINEELIENMDLFELYEKYPSKIFHFLEKKFGIENCTISNDIIKIDGGIAGGIEFSGKWKLFRLYNNKIELSKNELSDIDYFPSVIKTNGGIAGIIKIGGIDYPFKWLDGEDDFEVIRKDNEKNNIEECFNIIEIDGGITGIVDVGGIDYLFKWLDGEDNLDIIKKDNEGNNIENCFNVIKIEGGISGKVNILGINYIFKCLDGKESLDIVKKDNEGNEITNSFNIIKIEGGISGKVWIGGVTKNFKWLNGEELIIYSDKTYGTLEELKDEIGITTYNFLDFLEKGGEFLTDKELELGFNNLKNDFKLSELIYANNLETEKFSEIIDDNNYISLLSELFKNLQKKDLDLSIYKRKVLSQIDGQDKSSQIWIREIIQNSIDAINKSREENKKIKLNFFSHDNRFVASIFDEVGMTSKEVFKYLLPIGKSGKIDGEGIGKFGQGFFSLFVGAKEVHLKTGVGDGKTTYLKIVPIYNKNNLIEDFDITYEIKDENFKGTKIERIDESEGVESNLTAMFGINNIIKYTGCVSSVDIEYNGTKINGNNQYLGEEKVGELGNLKLIKNGGVERIEKDGLYMSEIKEIYLDIFPDWIIEIIKSEKLTIEIPNKIGLVSSRSEFRDKKDLDKLKPYIFNLITKYIVNLALEGKIKIPMLPEDYFGLDHYEKRIQNFGDIINISNLINNKGTTNEFEILKDKSNMALFLLMLEIEKSGEKISLNILKKRRHDLEFVNNTTNGRMSDNISKGANESNGLNRNMEFAYRGILSMEESSEYLNIEKEKIELFLNSSDEEFSKLSEVIFGNKIINNIYSRDGGESRAAIFGFNEKGIYMNWNILGIKKHIDYFLENGYFSSDFIEVITHELTHLKEGSNKWGSHEKDLEHDNSFEKIQREMLEIYLRLK